MYWHEICALGRWLFSFEYSSVKQNVGDENASWLVLFARIRDLHCEGLNRIRNTELRSWKGYLSLLSLVALKLQCVWVHLEGLVKHSLLGSPPQRLWFRRWGLVICIRTCFQVMLMLLIWELYFENHSSSLRLSFYQWENWGHKRGHPCTCINQILFLCC